MKEYNASYLALVHKSFQGDIQLSGPLTLMSCALDMVGFSNSYHLQIGFDFRLSSANVKFLWKLQLYGLLLKELKPGSIFETKRNTEPAKNSR